MPSIKDFNNIQPSASKKTSTGLWDMLDDFKTMITNNSEPEPVNILETPLSEITSLESDGNNNLKPSPLLETKNNTDIQKTGTKWVQSGCATGYKVGTKWVQNRVQTLVFQPLLDYSDLLLFSFIMNAGPPDPIKQSNYP